MGTGDNALRIIRLRRALAAAQPRHARRHNRSSAIWSQFRAYYKRNPRLSSRWSFYEEWDGRKRRWWYEDAYQLEMEAAILSNRLLNLLDAAVQQRGLFARPRRRVS